MSRYLADSYGGYPEDRFAIAESMRQCADKRSNFRPSRLYPRLDTERAKRILEMADALIAEQTKAFRVAE